MPWPWLERPLDSTTWPFMIGMTDLKQALLTGKKQKVAAELLQRWLPLAQGKQSCPLLPVCSLCRQTHLDTVPFSLSLPHRVLQLFFLSWPPTPRPALPR